MRRVPSDVLNRNALRSFDSLKVFEEIDAIQHTAKYLGSIWIGELSNSPVVNFHFKAVFE